MTRILVVDDEKHIRLLLENILSKEGYEVTTAINGLDGLSKIPEVNPAIIIIIITNIMMPIFDGYELLEAVQKDPELKRIPCIVLSAKTQKEDIEKAMKLGAVSYITKPFQPEALLQEIDEILNRVAIPS